MRKGTNISATKMKDESVISRITVSDKRGDHPSSSDVFDSLNWSSDGQLDPSPSFLPGEKSTRSLLSETSEGIMRNGELSHDITQSMMHTSFSNRNVPYSEIEQNSSRPIVSIESCVIQPQTSVASSLSRSKSLRRKLWKAALQLENNNETQTHALNLETIPVNEDSGNHVDTETKVAEELSPEPVGETIVSDIPNLDVAPIFSSESQNLSPQSPHQPRAACTVSTSVQESVSCVSDDVSLNAISSNMSESASYSELVKYMSYQDNVERGFEVLLHDSERFRRRYFPVIMEECEESQCSRSAASCDHRDECASQQSDSDRNKELSDDSSNKSRKGILLSKTYSNTSQRARSETTKTTVANTNSTLRNNKFKGSNPIDNQSYHSTGSNLSKQSTLKPSWFKKNAKTVRNKGLSPASSLTSGYANDIIVETVYSEAN
jgi:hypothetical protein